MMNQSLLIAMLMALLAGCGGSLSIHSVATVNKKPANIIVLYRVDDSGVPVADLKADNFTVTEDKQILTTDDWRFANPDLGAHQRTLLLLDYGGPVNDATRAELAAAARIFADVMSGAGKLAIYVFDGSERPQLIAPFSETVTEEALEQLDAFQQRDSSVDLHGAYRMAFNQLAFEVGTDFFDVGTLIVVSRGPDLASRVPLRDLVTHIDTSPASISHYAIGVGLEAQNARLDDLGDATPTYVANTLELGKALFALAETVKAQSKSYYVVSRCSTARAGEHRLTIDVKRTATGDDGAPKEQTARLKHMFSADGFGGTCDPTIAPEWRAPARENPEIEPETPAAPK
jgi:hypothetical protein